MGKGHYHGGSTLIGHGDISKARNRSGGIGISTAAVREERRNAEKKRRRELAGEIKANQKLARKLGKKWAEQRGREQYRQLMSERRAKESPLAAALHAAIQPQGDPES